MTSATLKNQEGRHHVWHFSEIKVHIDNVPKIFFKQVKSIKSALTIITTIRINEGQVN